MNWLRWVFLLLWLCTGTPAAWASPGTETGCSATPKANVATDGVCAAPGPSSYDNLSLLLPENTSSVNTFTSSGQVVQAVEAYAGSFCNVSDTTTSTQPGVMYCTQITKPGELEKLSGDLTGTLSNLARQLAAIPGITQQEIDQLSTESIGSFAALKGMDDAVSISPITQYITQVTIEAKDYLLTHHVEVCSPTTSSDGVYTEYPADQINQQNGCTETNPQNDTWECDGAILNENTKEDKRKPSDILAENLEKAGEPVDRPECQAHHIIPNELNYKNNYFEKARNVLQECEEYTDININSAQNGIALPASSKVNTDKCEGYDHSAIHTKKYAELLNEELVKPYNEAKDKVGKEEACKEFANNLAKVKNLLREGKGRFNAEDNLKKLGLIG